jgi:glycosyltransferase involved in cell wall biosynthesis
MAAGKPVFALWKWGLTETVIAWKTWEFFSKKDGKDFLEKFKIFHKDNLSWKYTSENCRKQAKKFDKNIFEKNILKLVKK